VRNEPLDLAVGNLAMFHLCRTCIDRFHDSNWQRLEKLTSAPPEVSLPPAPARPEKEPWIDRRDWFRR
jgi:hypothetical protein